MPDHRHETHHDCRTFMIATLGLAALCQPSIAQTCQCSCDSIIQQEYPNHQVDAVVMNESGINVEDFVGSDTTTAMAHATLMQFGTGMSVTHVCMQLKGSVAGQEGAIIEFAHPNPMNNDLPGPPVASYSFDIQSYVPHLGTQLHQIEELNPPFGAFDEMWVIVRYPLAQAGTGHQGIRERLSGAAAVWRADTNTWQYYDNTLHADYIGNTPAIRPLTLSTIPVTCPANGIPENEPNCGIDANGDPDDTVNGGCNSNPPVFFPVSCGDTICGTSELNDQVVPAVRDTDWYELVLTEARFVRWIAQADFDVEIFLVENDPQQPLCDPAAIIVLDTADADAGDTAIVGGVLDPGTYWLVVAPQWGQAGFSCGAEYVLSVDCCSITCGAGDFQESEPCGADLNGGCVTGSGFDLVPCNGMVCGELFADGGNVDEDWYEFTIPPISGVSQTFVNFTIDAELPVLLELYDDTCPLPFPPTFDGIVAPICQPTTLNATIPVPGTFHVRVTPDPALGGMGFPCGTSNRYRLHLDTGVNCQVAPQNDDCAGAVPVALGITTFDFAGSSASAPDDLGCGFSGPGSGEHDLWFEFVAPFDGDFTIELAPDPVSPLDRALALHAACPTTNGQALLCGVATGGQSISMTIALVAGETILIRAGAPAGAAQSASVLSIDGAALCPADLSGPNGFPDSMVDVFDLIELINQWGPCADPSNCPADLSGPAGSPDGEVDVFDLIELINNWGPCP